LTTDLVVEPHRRLLGGGPEQGPTELVGIERIHLALERSRFAP
jgi:hypothetical protein